MAVHMAFALVDVPVACNLSVRSSFIADGSLSIRPTAISRAWTCRGRDQRARLPRSGTQHRDIDEADPAGT